MPASRRMEGARGEKKPAMVTGAGGVVKQARTEPAAESERLTAAKLSDGGWRKSASRTEPA